MFETRPVHFFIPIPIFIIGGGFIAIPGAWDVWDFIGGLIITSGVACIYFLLYSAVKDHELQVLTEEHNHLAEIMKIDGAKKKTQVAIQKSDVMGAMYTNFSEVDISPVQLKAFAYGVLVQGRKLTIREWTPLKKGKTFSDGQWRKLIAFMKQPDWEDVRVKFIHQINANNENDGFELTAAGKKWLEDVASDLSISQVSQ